MSSLVDIDKALGKAISDAGKLATANDQAAAALLGERNAALQAAAAAGLSVDAGALPLLGAADAALRFEALGALLQDARMQIDQIRLLTS